MMEFKYGELNQDFYEVQIYAVGQSVDLTTCRISKSVMEFFITKLAKFIHSKYGYDIYIYDENTIDLNFILKQPFNGISNKISFKVGLGIADRHDELELNDFALDSAITLLSDEKRIYHVDCAISKNEEYIEQEKEWDKLGHFLVHGTMRDYRNKWWPTVTVFKDKE
ncbi:hypothetical protein [Apilactobacillus nanyangensis]|uniref:hypothetical protein n=1 Tax=Apilactobacillus nanyangensis TaxID=2799579 RepID=UPI0019457752|nr:hypothetical protein [Apilactobacillus nanyangensis]